MTTPIKFGICGLGRIGLVHARFFSQESDRYALTAVCDRDPQRVRQTVATCGCAGFDRFEAFLANPEMELAILATRSLDHAANAVQALAAGKTVLLEKPIAVTEHDLQELRKADRRYPGKLFFLHNHRFEPAFQSIRAILDRGMLGTLHVVKLCRHHTFRRRADWQALLACGGGQLSCWGPHVIDQALHYIRAPVKDVWSYLRRITTPGDADDHVRIVIVGENDAVAELEISDAVALPGPYCTVYGSRGTLICADEKKIRLKYIDPAYALPPAAASADQPPQAGGYGAEESFPWIEETVNVEPDVDMWSYVETAIARHLYDAIRLNIPFPIRNADAFEVARVIETVKKQHPQFDWKR